MAHISPSDILIDSHGVAVALMRRKGKAHRRPLRLHYPTNPAWEPGTGPVSLLARWAAIRQSPGFFSLEATEPLGKASLPVVVERALALVEATALPGFYFGSHSPRIGGFNELLNLQFTQIWVMQRLDWTSDTRFQVYHDSRILPTPMSSLFIAHMRTVAPQLASP